MTKMGLIIIALTLVMGVAHGNLLPDLNILPYLIKLTEDYQSIRIEALGTSVGLMAVPFNTLCRLPGVYDLFTCFLCNQDCIYGHNKFGGSCAPDPNNLSEITCICAETQDEASARGITRSSKDMCKWVKPSLLELPFVGLLIDTAFETVVKLRTPILLCPKYSNGDFESSGCVTDCVVNHGSDNATCKYSPPVLTDLGTTSVLHCECN